MPKQNKMACAHDALSPRLDAVFLYPQHIYLEMVAKRGKHGGSGAEKRQKEGPDVHGARVAVARGPLRSLSGSPAPSSGGVCRAEKVAPPHPGFFPVRLQRDRGWGTAGCYGHSSLSWETRCRLRVETGCLTDASSPLHVPFNIIGKSFSLKKEKERVFPQVSVNQAISGSQQPVNSGGLASGKGQTW